MFRRILLVLTALGALYWSLTRDVTDDLPSLISPAPVATPAPTTQQGSDVLRRAFDNQQSDVQVQAAGTVEKMLSDDNDGSRHQRFIVRVGADQTVLIAHNIDLAPRVAGLKEGDQIEFFGEYEWNNKGGVVHWTHHDPANRHIGGWIKHNGKTYQ
jgi:hypothetical protein